MIKCKINNIEVIKSKPFLKEILNKKNYETFDKNLNKDILYIAEIGVNHEGSIARCKKIIKQAKEAGADVVKFQCFTPEKYVSVGEKI